MWLPIAIIAYFSNAIAAIIDKILLEKAIPDPRIYAFLISIFGLFGILFAPFGISMISFKAFIVSIVIGASSVFSVWMLFAALKHQEASRVIPIVGGLQPILILFLAQYFVGETLSNQELLAVFLFVFGGILISYEVHESHEANAKSKKYLWYRYAIASGVGYGLFHVLSKYLYEQTTFVNGLVWPRLTTAFFGTLFLLLPTFRTNLKALFKNKDKDQKKHGILLVIAQLCGASFFVLINFAISIGPVTIINAMQGVQYVFVFLIMVLLSHYWPKIIKENISRDILIQKFIAIILIIIGIVLINI